MRGKVNKMKSYAIEHTARIIVISKAFGKRLNRLEPKAVGKMKQLKELFPEYLIQTAMSRNTHSNNTTYSDMEEIFKGAKRDDLLEALTERREAIIDINGRRMREYNFFENRKWFGEQCQKHNIKPIESSRITTGFEKETTAIEQETEEDAA